MKILIAYYSRTGNNRKTGLLLKEILDELPDVETELESIIDMKDRSGVSAYVLGGRDALMKKNTQIKAPEKDIQDYDLVMIGGPVWAWTVCPATRTYCAEHGRKAKKVAFFCTMGGSGDNRTFAEMETVCEKPPVAIMALTDGEIKKEGTVLREKLKEFVEKSLK